MKKIYTLLAMAFTLSGTIMAQQLPNDIGTFDGEMWDPCYPDGEHKVGVEPPGWSASNVFQLSQIGEFPNLVTSIPDRTAPSNKTYAVHLLNYYCGLHIYNLPLIHLASYHLLCLIYLHLYNFHLLQ